jgi:ABC-type protease/lipase transport system fused ATPase/permease subunit
MRSVPQDPVFPDLAEYLPAMGVPAIVAQVAQEMTETRMNLGRIADYCAGNGAALERLIDGKTAIIITHDLAIVQQAHQIVVLEDGRIEQQGTHSQLMEVEGRYRQLFQAQARELLVSQS